MRLYQAQTLSRSCSNRCTLQRARGLTRGRVGGVDPVCHFGQRRIWPSCGVECCLGWQQERKLTLWDGDSLLQMQHMLHNGMCLPSARGGTASCTAAASHISCSLQTA